MQREFLDALAGIVGAPNVLTGAQEIAPFCVDWRRQYRAAAEGVVRPGSTAEVASVVNLCAQRGVAVVPQGGNTGLAGGSVPAGCGPELVVSLSRLNRIRNLDALDDTLTAEAGCVLAQLQQAALGAERYFPVSLAAEGSCQLGGILSTNAGGVNVLRYGNAREQVLGLEVVLADGRVWDGLRSLRKDNTGYDLKHLFIGAEGTLGIITAAVLRLRPRPTCSATAWIATDAPASAVKLLARLRARLGDRVSAFELISRRCLEAVLGHVPQTRDPLGDPHPWYVLAEFEGMGESAPLREQLELALADSAQHAELRDAAVAATQAQSAALWRIRESIPEAQFANVKHDVSVAVSRVPALIERIEGALPQAFPGACSFIFGHVGDGNLHYNIGMGDAAATAQFMQRREAVNALVYEAVSALGGSISAEHGIGQLKRVELAHRKSPLELELMRTLKRALDPGGLMNPGKVL